MMNACFVLPRLIAGAAALALASPGSTQPAPPAREPETRDRISSERLEALIAGPAKLIGDERIEAAERAFEVLLGRQGAGTPAAADHLTGFGLAMFTSGDEQARERSIAYFRRAVDAFRAAFGPAHPEVALSLRTYADAQTEVWPADPPREADAALAEAYRIRHAALGPRNIETLANLIGLAEVAGLPSRTGGDRVRIEAAAAHYREAVRTAGSGRRAVYGYIYSDFTIYLRLARMYARNGLPDEAAGAVQEALDVFDLGTPHGADRCIALYSYGAPVIEALVEQEQNALADELHRRLGLFEQCVAPDSESVQSAIATVLSSV